MSLAKRYNGLIQKSSCCGYYHAEISGEATWNEVIRTLCKIYDTRYAFIGINYEDDKVKDILIEIFGENVYEQTSIKDVKYVLVHGGSIYLNNIIGKLKTKDE